MTRDIHRCVISARYTKYFQRINLLYFDGQLPNVKVYTAPLLKITAHGQKEVENNETLWLDPGEYGIVGKEPDGEWCIIVDKATSVYHAILTKQTIIHESVHIEQHPYKGHGVRFNRRIRQLAAKGALDGLI
jgi:hypothetical protein